MANNTETENHLTRDKKFFQSIIENSLDAIVLLDENADIKYLSASVENILGPEPNNYLKKNGLDVIHTDDLDIIKEKLISLISIPDRVESALCRVNQPDGKLIWVEASAVNKLDDPEINSIIVNFRDVTEKKIAEERLHDTTLRMGVLIGNLNNVVLYETGGGREFVTQNIFNLLGYPPEKFTEDRKFFTSLIHPDDIMKLDLQTEMWYKNGAEDTLKMEFRCRRSDGEYVWFEDNLTLINPPEKTPYMTGILIDITERKNAENTIRDSLKEKEILLREIHHRVKNNLQVISSLLKIQSSYAGHNGDKEIFTETLNRLRSMSMIHQLLYKSNSLSKIGFDEYVYEMLNSLKENIHAKNLSFDIESDNIILSIDIAVPCGLLINELVSLILKEQQDGSEKILIRITVRRPAENGNIIITLECDNCQVPENSSESKSLGLQLVNTLLEQIDGALDIDKANGIKYSITFVEDQYLERLP
jgi:PAS domain S-box-containing protein